MGDTKFNSSIDHIQSTKNLDFSSQLCDDGRICLWDKSGEAIYIGLWLIDRIGKRHELSLLAPQQYNCADHDHVIGWCPVLLFETGNVSFDGAKTLAAGINIYKSQNRSAWSIEVELKNTQAAHHPGGLWDLGDPASAYFEAFGIDILTQRSPDGTKLDWHSSESETGENLHRRKITNGATRLVQFSSGNALWNHQNHISANGIVPLKYRGWQLDEDAINNDRATGLHCEPEVTMSFQRESQVSSWLLKPIRFWQNSPTAINVTPGCCSLELFAASTLIEGEFHELQAGEQKRRHIIVSYREGIEGDNLDVGDEIGIQLKTPKNYYDQPVNTILAPEGIRSVELVDSGDERIANMLLSPEEFLEKRERIDEFGWRNYGEVFADHESLYTDDPIETPLVSHYNNQYDLIFGFGLQYLRTKNPKWFQLMDELALHVVDIDIYHTSQDRNEYNGGLFWHTNHYTDAFTATHRTFTREAAKPEDPIGTSGGPGPEHCYTTGLSLHWQLTGNIGSREAVLGLADWINSWFEGEDLLLAQIWLIVKRDIPAFAELIRGKGNGYSFPLTRATGNLIIALLDAHDIDGSAHRLETAADVLRNTFGPDDNIDDRNLLDVETRWSYTVFLQAVLRFLEHKERHNELDEDWRYARDGFISYTRWMSEHENPYLEKPELLEFVNDTWAAQDVRKYVLMMAASYYDSKNVKAYDELAQRVIKHVDIQLRSSNERKFARIQAILLFNLGIASWVESRDMPSSVGGGSRVIDYRTGRKRRTLKRIKRRISKGAKSFSILREFEWFNTRILGRRS